MTAPRLRFGVVPEVVIACAILVACICVASCLSGCGASAVGTQYQALRVAATIYDSATDGAEAALTTQAQGCAHDDACLDAVRLRWLPVAAAQSAVLVLLQGWAGLIQLWEAAGDLPSLLRAGIRQVEAIGRAWNAWASASSAAGWLSLPPLPPEVLTFAAALGGAE